MVPVLPHENAWTAQATFLQFLKHGGKCGEKSFYMFLIFKDVFCTRSCLFFSTGLSLVLWSFGCFFFFSVHSVFWEFEQITNHELRQWQRVQWLCCLHYNFVLSSFVCHSSQNKNMKKVFRENVNYGGKCFITFFFRILTLSYIFCLEYL